MSVKLIELEIPKIKTFKSMYKKAFIGVVIIAFILGILDSGGSGSFFKSFFATLFLLGIPVLGAVAFYQKICIKFGIGFIKSNMQQYEQALKKLGFNNNYSGIGIVIDTEQKKIAFLGSTNSKALICDFSDVRSWHQSTMQETTQYRNQDNSYAGSKIQTLFIHIVVHLASPEYPEARFIVRGDREASIWIARLNALING